MKINIVAGFFLPIPPECGGATEKIWYRLATWFAAAGHQVTIVSRMWPAFPNEEIRDNVRFIRVPGSDHTRWLARNLWLDWRWGVRASRVLPSADVTICNTVTLPMWLPHRRPGVGKVIPCVSRMPKGQARWYRRVALVLSLSEAVTNALVAENPRLATRIRPFPFPIDWQKFVAARASRVTPAGSPLTIGYIGRIHPEKGIDLLLEAASRLAERGLPVPWRLFVAGPSSVPAGGGGDSYLTALERRYRARLNDRLTIMPPEFDTDRLSVRYAEVDVFCYPSIAETGETFGVSVAEAMAAGAVPVVSALPCFKELVTRSENGLVFDHRAPDAANRLTNALEYALISAEWRTAAASRAQHHVRRFDISAVAARLEADLLEMLAAS